MLVKISESSNTYAAVPRCGSPDCFKFRHSSADPTTPFKSSASWSNLSRPASFNVPHTIVVPCRQGTERITFPIAGGVALTISLRSNIMILLTDMFQAHERKAIMACGTKGSREMPRFANGLLGGHAYSIRSVEDIDALGGMSPREMSVHSALS